MIGTIGVVSSLRMGKLGAHIELKLINRQALFWILLPLLNS